VYGIALSVSSCLRAGTRVDVAWIVEADGFTERDGADALAITPGGGRIGSLLSGALDSQLAEVAGRGSGRMIDAEVSDVDALVAGLPSGGAVRCLVVPADALPGDLWELLSSRSPVGLVTRLDGDEVVDTTLLTATTVDAADEDAVKLFARRASGTAVMADRVLTVLWPVPELVVVGGGPIADALGQAAGLLGWRTRTVLDRSSATGMIAGLSALDNVVVAAHDLDLAGPALAAALDSDAGYIGALGSKAMQRSRADWLAYRGITHLERIHGPAGLDIGADTPPKIAIAILAEAIAAETGRTLVP
jgi:xanthine dehydrogenase accessory factor